MSGIDDLYPLRELAQRHPDKFRPTSPLHMLRNRETNGLAPYLRWLNGSPFISDELLRAWLDSKAYQPRDRAA